MAWKEALDGALAALIETARAMGIEDVKKWALANGGFENDFAGLCLSNIGSNVGALVEKGYPPEVLATVVLVLGQICQQSTPSKEEGDLQ